MDWLGLIPVIDRLPTSRYPGGRRNPSKIVPHYAISWESDEDTTDKGATERGPLIPTKWHMATSIAPFLWLSHDLWHLFIHNIYKFEKVVEGIERIFATIAYVNNGICCFPCLGLAWPGKMALGKSQVGSFVQDSIREAMDPNIYIMTPLYLNGLLMSC